MPVRETCVFLGVDYFGCIFFGRASTAAALQLPGKKLAAQLQHALLLS